jgi:hypothetical protein
MLKDIEKMQFIICNQYPSPKDQITGKRYVQKSKPVVIATTAWRHKK